MSRRIKLIKAAKLISLSSFKLIGKMRENKIRKDEKRKRHFMIFYESCTILTNLEQKRTTTLLLNTTLHKSACVHLFDATLEFDATELNATFKSPVVFCHITVGFNCI